MLDEQSVEEQRYLTSLDRETKAFKGLIEEKARMTVSVRTTSSFWPAERTARDGKVTRFSIPLAEAGNGSSSGIASSRRGGRRKAQASLRVVVDLREFRSVLPNLLHQQRLALVPLVITVDDYVLTPPTSVERKSLSDLFLSMSSGRLYVQVEAILKHYKVPVLLIEINPDKAVCLLGSGDLTSEMKLTSITSQLTLMTLHFPQLRILWSKSEHATADIFKELMENNAAVDVAKAHQAAGGGGEDDQRARRRRLHQGAVHAAARRERVKRLTRTPRSGQHGRPQPALRGEAAALARRGERRKAPQVLQTARACVVVCRIFFHFCRQSFKMTTGVPNSSNIVRSRC